MSQYIYLHGFASSPRSTKARDLSDRFRALNLSLQVPDLNQNNFTELTLTRQIQQVRALFPAEPESVTLIGSSLGGLTAAWLGQQFLQVEKLVLLAPAFQFLTHWSSRLGAVQLQHWRETGYLSVYHYSKAQPLPLSYNFLLDTQQYDENKLQRPIPTLILHGLHDDVVPIQASIDYTSLRSWVTLIQLDSDHALTNVSNEIWTAIQSFCQLECNG